ncbi:MAG: FAD:protein FMN transferase [Thiotrichales bacterium]|jgi:thiamine biosynthesis lipoprotein|nr:FAD:protein FMN transferase [Thiotrichales bacterium]MBT3612956.1 FAD:protein FMN transferase [Thiotrichales bacterium]MBT3752635.1 FAD:protein FMN transferase [Thiotrichales bacterium]MBT3837922.1 FAD:protein FMN transferase [Thiotrichales bacterium]MBT4151710.1 FAD:protein FMN transferase [Thiotrichales bacterium]
MRTAATLLLISTIITSTLTLIGCQPQPKIYQDQFLAFGTVVSISIWDATPAQNSKASRIIRDEFQAMHNEWHAWKKGGLLHDINQAIATEESLAITPEVKKLLQKSAELSRNSNYLFNPAIGNLVALWGFHSEEWSGPPPSQNLINALIKSTPNLDQIEFKQSRLYSNNKAVKIDLGGIAKGYAVARAITQLKKIGIKNGIVNTGGDLQAIGVRGERAWSIGIRAPDSDKPLALLHPNDGEAIFTSGDYERMFSYQGERYHHIIDPRTGWPSNSAHSATVIHSDAMVADAAATALLIAAPEQRRKIATKMGVTQFLVIEKDHSYQLTEEMRQRVEFTQTENPIKVTIKVI